SWLSAAPRTQPLVACSQTHAPEAASQSRSVLSCAPDTAQCPSALQATVRTASVWPSNTRVAPPVGTSHSRTARSRPPVSARLPSGLTATAWTPPACASTVCRQAPVPASQKRSAPSIPADNSRSPDASSATDRTQPVCPSKVRMQRAESASQSRAVRSTPAVASSPRPVWSASALTSPSWPTKSRTCLPVATSQARATASPLSISPIALYAVRPSGDSATAFTSFACSPSVRRKLPLGISQRRSVRSRLPLSARWPSALQATELTRRWCPPNVPRSVAPLKLMGSRVGADEGLGLGPRGLRGRPARALGGERAAGRAQPETVGDRSALEPGVQETRVEGV